MARARRIWLAVALVATGCTLATEFWTMDDATLGADLKRVVHEESVHCLDDLVLRRSNWALSELDLDRLRDRVARYVDLPVTAQQEPRA